MKETVRCTLKIAYKEKYLMKIRELNKIQQDIRGNVNNINLFEENELKQLNYYQRM